jgi:hypothetical protein
MKKIKSFKLFAGIALFVDALTMITVIIVLSVQKKSIPKALVAALAAGSILAAVLLISYKKDQKRKKNLREMDAFYDYDYDTAYGGFDDDDKDIEIEADEDFGLDTGDDANLSF